MSTLSEYTHIEKDIDAVQLTLENQGEVMAVILEHVKDKRIIQYDLALNEQTGAYELTFKYNGDSTAHTLKTGDYLVVLNTGSFYVVPEATFIEHYIHSSLDPEVKNTKTVAKSLVDFAASCRPNLNIKTEADLTDAKLLALAESLKDNAYNQANDVFRIDFQDCGLVDFTGLAKVIDNFLKASFITSNTAIEYIFSNTNPGADMANNLPNQFNIIGLMGLVAELKLVSQSVRNRKSTFIFSKSGTGVSPIVPSVTEKQIESFQSEMNELLTQPVTYTITYAV